MRYAFLATTLVLAGCSDTELINRGTNVISVDRCLRVIERDTRGQHDMTIVIDDVDMVSGLLISESVDFTNGTWYCKRRQSATKGIYWEVRYNYNFVK